MDNNAFKEEEEAEENEYEPVYDNYSVTPDIITQQPVRTPPSHKTDLNEPITASALKDENDVNGNGGGGDGGAADSKGRKWRVNDGSCSAEGERTTREWSSGLFDSLTRKPQPSSSYLDVFKQAVRDCCCVPCMMCSLGRRLGDPSSLPFLPCTGPALRFKVRILGTISGYIGEDCVVTSCCWPCAVCQMHRELEDIGI